MLRNDARLQPIPIRVGTQPVHPLARLQQAKGRWYTTQSYIRHFTSSAKKHVAEGIKYDRSTYPKSRTSAAIAGLTGRTPFATTLRPNLTGGTLGRTAGGYGFGSGRIGSARYFSHTPAAPAQVVQNVSQAVRAFCLAGQKAQYEGTGPRGEKRYRAVSTLQDETVRKVKSLPKATPGSYIDFHVNPSITALTPLSAVAGYPKTASAESELEPLSINTDGLLDVLSIDFSRALKDLAAILNDLKRLSALGDMPITYSSASTLRIHFPGCDADTVERLCDELDVKRGMVVQDADFDAFVGTDIALLFPFAPSNAASIAGSDMEEVSFLDRPLGALSECYSGFDSYHDTLEDRYSTLSEQSQSDHQEAHSLLETNPWAFLNESEGRLLTSPDERATLKSASSFVTESRSPSDPLEFQSFEGIYRFLAECQ